MKKLVLLLMVLGMATGAYALTGVQLSIGGATDGEGNVTEQDIDVCSEIVIDIHAPAEYAWVGYIIIADPNVVGGEGGEWGDDLGAFTECLYYEDANYPKVTNAGNLGDAIRYTEDDWGYGYEVTAGDSSSATNIVGGKEFELIYHCCSEQDVVIYLFDVAGSGYDPEDAQDTILLHQIPEPATLALLGLGGLFLRRRK